MFIEVLVNALVTSYIAYCNVILASMPSKLIHQLQLIQNSAALIVMHSKSTEHVTPLLIQLHRLPVSKRINFKIVLLTFEALHNLCPAYLTDLLQIYTPPCSLQPASAGLLELPAIKLSTMAATAFSYSAPKL